MSDDLISRAMPGANVARNVLAVARGLMMSVGLGTLIALDGAGRTSYRLQLK